MMSKGRVFGLLMFLLLILAGAAQGRAQSGTTDRSANGVTCASDDGRRHYCPLDTSRGVMLQKQRSSTPCIQGQSWGFDRRGVWVDRGCRGEFVSMRQNRPGGGYGTGMRILQCSSDNGNRVECPAYTRGGVRLVRQRSDARCIQGRTWGYTQRSIWVDRGCRADFSVAR
jgi:hypothetical protein